MSSTVSIILISFGAILVLGVVYALGFLFWLGRQEELIRTEREEESQGSSSAQRAFALNVFHEHSEHPFEASYAEPK